VSRQSPDPERVTRESSGRWAEQVAAVFLMLHGHRILGRRQRTPHGEIDIVARRRRRIVFVEVKYRRSQAEAEDALRPKQARRVARAADYWLARRPAFEDFEQGFDAILVLPWSWPKWIRDAYEPVGTSGPML